MPLVSPSDHIDHPRKIDSYKLADLRFATDLMTRPDPPDMSTSASSQKYYDLRVGLQAMSYKEKKNDLIYACDLLVRGVNEVSKPDSRLPHPPLGVSIDPLETEGDVA
jgi:hypothetical protein